MTRSLRDRNVDCQVCVVTCSKTPFLSPNLSGQSSCELSLETVALKSRRKGDGELTRSSAGRRHRKQKAEGNPLASAGDHPR